MREGSPFSKLAQAIGEHGYNDFDRYNLATVMSLTPTLVKVDGSNLELDAYDLIIAEHLTDHERTVTLNGAETVMSVKSPLNVGDRVIVASVSGLQMYVVLDKAVMI